jgi:hypothetical protein
MRATDFVEESNRVHTDDGKIRVMSWDILEVNRYLMDGLNRCELDSWFDGEGENRVPTVTLDDIRAPPVRRALAEVMQQAREALNKPPRRPWEPVELLAHSSAAAVDPCIGKETS